MLKLLLIALGGAAGSVLRFAMQGWMQNRTGGIFPAGTLLINILGCLAIGFLMALFTGPFRNAELYRDGLVIGILGGFTTFSAFGWETIQLLDSRQYGSASLYVGLSVGAGLLATLIGLRFSQWIYGT